MEKEVLKTWLFHQCRMLSGSIHAVLLTGAPDKGPFKQTLFWPEVGYDHSVLSSIAQAALRYKRAVIKTRNNIVQKTCEPLDALACPLFMEGQLFGVVAIEMTHRSQPMQQATVRQVQLGVRWLQAMMMLHGSTAKEQLVNLVDMVATGLDHEYFTVAATEVTNELAERLSCNRVSLGFLRFNRVRIEAVSYSSRIDRHSKLLRSIRDAMSESLDQGATVVYPAESDTTVLVTRFHSELAKMVKGTEICTVPMVKNGKAVGALLLERGLDKPFAAETVEKCEQIGVLLGSVMEIRRREERSLPYKLLDSMQNWFAKIFGPRNLPLKVAVTLSAALLIWLFLASTMFRISCDSVLEAEVCRAAVAPQQGYIAAAHVRAGDLVREGDVLAVLDDRELRLEQRKWQSQRAQLLKEYRRALAGFDRAEVAILNAKRAQAEAQLSLVEQQLTRTRLIAPFSGLIVKGDLSQSLGSPVERGEVLFEVAPTSEYRVVLNVDERDIGLVSSGLRGQLKLSGIPNRKFAITIDRITPVSANYEGRNCFRVDAVMHRQTDLIRPGMEGIAKIEIGRKKLLWIWTRRLVEWLRLFVWNHLP